MENLPEDGSVVLIWFEFPPRPPVFTFNPHHKELRCGNLHQPVLRLDKIFREGAL
jgi:hypothetical protein